MKAPCTWEIDRIRERLDPKRIERGQELQRPLSASCNYLVGGDYVMPEEMVVRLARRVAELEAALGYRP